MLIRKMYIHFWLFQAFLKFLDTPTDCVNPVWLYLFLYNNQTNRQYGTNQIRLQSWICSLFACKQKYKHEWTPGKHVSIKASSQRASSHLLSPIILFIFSTYPLISSYVSLS